MSESTKKQPLFTKAHKAGIAVFLFFLLVGLPASVIATKNSPYFNQTSPIDVQISGDSVSIGIISQDKLQPPIRTRNDLSIDNLVKVGDYLRTGRLNYPTAGGTADTLIWAYDKNKIEGDITDSQKQKLGPTLRYVEQQLALQDKYNSDYQNALSLNPGAEKPDNLMSQQELENAHAWMAYVKDLYNEPTGKDASNLLSKSNTPSPAVSPIISSGVANPGQPPATSTTTNTTQPVAPVAPPAPVYNRPPQYTAGQTAPVGFPAAYYGGFMPSNLVNVLATTLCSGGTNCLNNPTGYTAPTGIDGQVTAPGSLYGSNYGYATMQYNNNIWQQVGFSYGNQNPTLSNSYGAPTQNQQTFEPGPGGSQIFTGNNRQHFQGEL